MENNNFLNQYVDKKALHELAIPLNRALELADAMVDDLRFRGGRTDLAGAEDLVLALAKTVTLLEEFLAKTKPVKT